MINSNNVLKQECSELLFEYQVDRMNQIYREFLELNSSQKNYQIHFCPKCGIENPITTKGGFSNSGKQMLRCTSCNKRFVEDSGRLTFYSHQSSAQWSDFIKATMQTASLKESAALIDVHERTAFRMRHKLLNFVEAANALEIEETPLANEVEIDETYYHEMHKGLRPRDIVALEDEIKHLDSCSFETEADLTELLEKRDRLVDELHQKIEELNEKHRGLSSDLVCVITGVERLGGAVIKATNMARPSSDDIRKFSSAIMNESYVFIDGCSSYFSVLDEKDCPYTVCPSKESYDKVNHLNNVNSLHSKMDEIMRKYRGVSTIYINRYNALFRCLHEFMGCDPQEIAVNIIRKLGKIQHYFYDREISKHDIFDDPQVMANRSRRIDRFTHTRELKAAFAA